MALEKIHITYLKEFIDQLIINKGIIQVAHPERVIEKIKIDFLVKLAFRFYSKLYSSEKYASYLKITEDYIKNSDEKEYQHILQDMLNIMNEAETEHTLQCLNCGAAINIEEIKKLGDCLPLCSDCQNEIGLEMDIWEKVFD
ncbi:MAG: hypothetical protein PHY08_08580 [Candidatus Cloacimonetes bacterium]|nr:hypothetical protein [Candidatus Cloacimonadota bacterium]